MSIKRFLKLVSIGAVLASTLITSSAQAVVRWHFSDGFDYFDAGKWEKSNGWSNEDMFNCTWRDRNVNFYNGQMELKIDRDWGSKPYSGGEYRTREKFGYGLYQVRMKPAKNPGIVTSFFTYTGPTDGTPWDEIDIEFLGKNTNMVQFNYYTNGVGNHEYVHWLGFDASQAYHTYAFNWQPNYIAWLVDGREVYRAWNNIPSNPGKIMLNMWPGINVDSWLGRFNGRTPLTASYDWMAYDPI